MSYSRGLGLDFAPGALPRATLNTGLTAATTRTASAPVPGRSMGFSGELGRLNALKILIRPYLVALQQATLSSSLTLGEKAQLAERLKAARKLSTALDGVRPASGGWVASDVTKLRVIASSGMLPAGLDINLLTKSGSTQALQYARQIAQAWSELQSSLLAGPWAATWGRPASGGGAPLVGGASTIFTGGRILTGDSVANRAIATAEKAANMADQARLEAERARERADTEAAIAAARAEAEAAAATAAALQEAVAQAQATASEQTAALQAALQQAEAQAAEAAQRAQAELEGARKRGKLWIWGLAALAAGGIGYAVLRRK